MTRVLRRLDFCDEGGRAQIKGKVACEISAADEVVATELLFSGFLSALEPPVLAAVCSCLVFTDQRGESKMCKNEELVRAFDKIRGVAERVATVLAESKLNVKKVLRLPTDSVG